MEKLLWESREIHPEDSPHVKKLIKKEVRCCATCKRSLVYNPENANKNKSYICGKPFILFSEENVTIISSCSKEEHTYKRSLGIIRKKDK